MNRLAIHFAASTMAVSATMVGCSNHIAGAQLVTSATGRTDVQAARLTDQAREATARGEHGRALTLIERAVELSPRDSGYRLLLAELYLRNGRFRSAESGFRDVLQLDAGNMRAAISLALVQIAQGRNDEATEQLSQLHGRAPASDLGLALALAGRHDQAIALLETAARQTGATARVRQNLALAHALAGNWQQARVIAAQDVSPADLTGRLQQWAAMAQPAQPHTQVATLLNITPSEDPGQPVRLALAPAAPEAPVYAEAAPSVEQPVELAAAEPVAVAEAQPYSVPQPPIQVAYAAPVPIQVPVVPAPAAEAPTPAQEEIRVAAAVRTLVQAQPEIVAPSRRVATPPRPAFARRADRPAAPTMRRAGGNAPVVVQLGAFTTAQSAERAFASTGRRFGIGRDQAVTTTVNMGGRMLHRLSIAGFANRREAVQLCGTIRARGGTCFVRATAGDSPVRWAWRNPRGPRRG